MDKNTFSEYGWIIIVIILLAFILAFIPVLNSVINTGIDDSISIYFEDNEGGRSKLRTPTLFLSNTDLVISSTSVVEEYEIILNSISVGNVPATHPKTLYDLSGLPDGEYEIQVVAKARDYNDSEPGKTFVVLPLPALREPVLSISETALVIRKGSPETERYEISIDGAVSSTVDAKNPTVYNLSSLASGAYKITVVAMAEGWLNSAPSDIEYKTTSVITQDDIDNSDGHLVPIGKTDPLYVIAQFNDDFTSVIIFKNGEDSDGIMRDFDVYASTLGPSSPFVILVHDTSPLYTEAMFYALYNFLEYEQKGLPLEGTRFEQFGSHGEDYNGDGYINGDDLSWLEEHLTVIDEWTPSIDICDIRPITSAVIKHGVTNLGAELFAACVELRTIFVANTVTSIGASAFDTAFGLYEVPPLTINFEASTAPEGFDGSNPPEDTTINYNIQ